MIFWIIVFGVSVIGICTLLLIKILKPGTLSIATEHHPEDDLNKNLDLARRAFLKFGGNLQKGVGYGFSAAWGKSLSKIKDTKLSGLVRGEGTLKTADTKSNFLKDVKEHRDRVREGLTNDSNNDNIS